MTAVLLYCSLRLYLHNVSTNGVLQAEYVISSVVLSQNKPQEDGLKGSCKAWYMLNAAISWITFSNVHYCTCIVIHVISSCIYKGFFCLFFGLTYSFFALPQSLGYICWESNQCLVVFIPCQDRGPWLGRLCKVVNDMNMINNSEWTLCGSKQRHTSVPMPSVNSGKAAARLVE